MENTNMLIKADITVARDSLLILKCKKTSKVSVVKLAYLSLSVPQIKSEALQNF